MPRAIGMKYYKTSSSRENFSLELCEFNVQNYSIAQRYFGRLNHQWNYLKKNIDLRADAFTLTKSNGSNLKRNEKCEMLFCYLNFLLSFTRRRLLLPFLLLHKTKRGKETWKYLIFLIPANKKGALKHKIVNRFIHLLLIIFHSFFFVAQRVDDDQGCS
jgi:hypothetical protein